MTDTKALRDAVETATNLLSLAYQEFQKEDGTRHAVTDNSGRKVWLLGEDVMRDLWASLNEMPPLLALLSAEGNGWRPIEAAPADTTLILHGWNMGKPEHGSHIVIGSKYRERWVAYPAENGNRDIGAPMTFLTHWMPLPPSPTEAE